MELIVLILVQYALHFLSKQISSNRILSFNLIEECFRIMLMRFLRRNTCLSLNRLPIHLYSNCFHLLDLLWRKLQIMLK